MEEKINTPENTEIEKTNAVNISDTAENAAVTENAAAAEQSQPKKPARTKEEKRKRRFWIRLIAFVAAMLILLTYVIYVLTPKYPYGICSLYHFYSVPKDTIDVLAVGTSLTYTDVNTNILWDEYGIACYDLATAEQPYWSTYYYLKEALKLFKPKVVLLDLKAITYLDDKVDRMRTVLCSYGLLNPVSRLANINECTEPENFWGYALAFPQIHSNYAGLKASDFDIPPSYGNRGESWKGYIEKNETAEHDAPNINYEFKTAQYVNEHESEYFRKILQLCVDNDVTVMLIGYPNADYKHDHLYYCSAVQIAEEYGITGINYNLPENSVGIDYGTECADWQHLNISGSVKFSRALGEDLMELYDLEDHRGDPAYASYDECASIWFDKYPSYRRALY